MRNTRQMIHAKVVELAGHLGHKAGDLGYDELIPVRGGLDSAALMELILWYENEFGLEIQQDELTIENFGTIDAMATYAEKAGA